MRLPAFLLATALLLPSAPARAAEELSVVVSGKPKGTIEAYKAGSAMFLEAKQLGSILGGQVYWYPVSGRIQLSLRGRSLKLLADAPKVTLDGREVSLSEPVRVRASRALIPMSFLRSEAFSRWAGVEFRLDDKTKTLVVERAGTVGPARVFSYGGRTRISLTVAPRAPYRAVARGTGGVDLVAEFGVVEGEETVSVQDGVVDSFSLKQEAAVARLSIRFAEKGLKWRVSELSDPRRVALDIYGAGVEPETETAENPEVAPSKVKTETTVSPKKEPVVRAETEKKKRRLVVVDAGHGGKDPGATGRRGTKEKDVNLAAALELASVLKERGDFDVILTRDSDEFVPLSERSDLANQKEADLFVSLHCNAAGNRREKGWEVYSVSETASDPEAEKLAAAENAALAYEGKDAQEETAKMILLAMTKTEMINESAAFSALTAKSLTKRMDIEARGAKQAGFYVLRGTHAPAILVEMAFVSHAEDEAKLASRRFRRAMAEGVATGIADYARRQGWLQ